MSKKTKGARIRSLCEKGKYGTLLRVVPQEELRQGFEPDLTQPIHYFAARGDLQAVRELVESYKCNPECQNVYGITPLHCASYCGRLSVVKYLINKHKCSANAKDEEGACPLAYASYCVTYKNTMKCPLDIFEKRNEPRSKHLHTAKFLISHSKLQKTRLKKELCILRLPVCCGLRFDDFKQLLESILSLRLGYNLPEVCSELKKCLEIALEQTKLDYIENLLHTYANCIKVAMKSDVGQSSTFNLFHKACSKADIDVIKWFFELDICKPDVQSLKIAIDRKDYELVQLLLQSADHPLLMDRFERWSSMLSYIFDCQVIKPDQELVKIIVDATVSTDVRDAEGNTPLHLVCEHSVDSIAKEYSCYQNVMNNKHELPVHIACKMKDLKLIKLVSSQLGGDINAQDVQGNTLLHVACTPVSHNYNCAPSYFDPNYLETLLNCLKYIIHEKKCGINIKNNLGELPLHTFLISCVGMQMSRHYGVDMMKEVIELLMTGEQCYINVQDGVGNTPLHIACKLEDLDTIYYLLSKAKCDINIQNYCGELPLHIFLKVEHREPVFDAKDPVKKIYKLDVIEKITGDQCYRVSAQDNEGNTPLHIACKIRDPETIYYLVSKFQCDVNISYYKEWCVSLHYALSSNLSVETVRTVRNNCTLKCKQNNVGKTPLHIACEEMQHWVIDECQRKALIKTICDQNVINIQDDEGNTPLHTVCRNGDLETATYLISQFQCDLDLLNGEHCLPLHYMVSWYKNSKDDDKALKSVKIVSKRCTLMHVQNSSGVTPLHIACESGYYRIVKYLVFERKCFPSSFKRSSDIYDSLMIHLTCRSECDIDLLKALATECNVNNKADGCYDEFTPLHVACENSNHLAVKLLLGLNCDVMCKDSQGRLPFHIACFKSLECVKVMSPYTTNDIVNACDKNGNTSLHNTLQNNHLDIVEFLLSKFQCDVSIKNKQKELPIHIACKTTLSIVRMVMESNSQSMTMNCQTNNNGDTPLHIACMIGALDIVKYLVLTEMLCCKPCMRLRNNEGKLPVDYACEHSLQMVKLVSQPCTVEDLVLRQYESDKDTNALNSHYNYQKPTTLDIACKNGSLDIVTYLVNEKGCTLSALNNNYSALWYACGLLPYDDDSAPRPEIVQFLIDQCGYNPCMTFNSASLFQYSCEIDSLPLINVLPINNQLDIQDVKENTPIHFACKYDRVDIVQHLVNCGSNQNTVNNKGESPLHIACRSSLKVTKLLTNCDVNLKNADGQTPLHIACASKKMDIAQYLIEEMNCDVNCQDNYGDTPLHDACFMRDSEIIQFLLAFKECRADIFNEDDELALHDFLNDYKGDVYSFNKQSKIDCIDNYYRPLKISITSFPDIVCSILQRYPAAAITTNHDGFTPIDMIIMRGELETFEILLDSGEIIDKTTKKKLLLIACENARPDIVHWLIERGSNEVVDDDGNLPQHVCFKCDYFCLQTLTQLGHVDVCKQGKNNDTILHLACRSRNEDVLKYILQTMDNCGKALSIQNNNKDTPLHLLAASRIGLLDSLTLVVTDNPNLQDKSGNTALHLACQYRHYELAEHLITKCKCDFNMTNDKGELPLHIAIAQSLLKITQFLADPENVNRCTKNGDLPLHIACRSSTSLEVLKLVATLDNSNVQNNDGDTPLHIACRGNDLNIALYLFKELKCSVELLNKDSETAFHILFNNSSYHHSSSELKKYLLSYIPQRLNDVTNKIGDTMLHIACQNADHVVATYLIKTFGCKIVDAHNENSGATALHFACTGSLDIVKVVVQCNPTSQIKDVSYLPKEMEFVSHGDTPLHVACRKGKIDVIRHLLQCGHSQSLNYSNALNELPVHLAVAANHSISVMKLFLRYKEYFDGNAANESNGDTLLHIMCRHKCHVHCLKLVVYKLQCKVYVQNKEGNLPLHIACQNEHISNGIVKLLCDALSDDQIKHRNKHGNTALHEYLRCSHMYSSHDFHKLLQIFVARGLLPQCIDDQVMDYLHLGCRYQKLNIVKYLCEKYISPSVEIPNSLLHETCLNCNEHVLEYMLKTFENVFDVNVPNENGDLPVHLAARMKVCIESTVFLAKKTGDINHKNNQGETPLHELYNGDPKTFHEQKILIEFLKSNNVDLSAINAKGFTPLHCMCRAGKFDDFMIVGKQRQINANMQDKNGATLLHLACQANNFDAVKILLTSSEANPSIEDHKKQPPIILTTDPKIIKMLIEYGADPQPLYNKFYSFEKPHPTPVKLLVIGYPSVGKTTLIQSLQNELPEEVISDHFNHTAGIVTTNFSSQHYGVVTFYDFAGQAEYYASHDAVLHSTIKNVPPVLLVLVNLNEPKKVILNQTKYWINLMANRCSGLGSEAAHMILVGSHADVLESKGRNPSEKVFKLHQLVAPQLEKKSIFLKGYVYLNCTLAKSSEMSRLQQLLQQSTSDLREKGVMDFNSHCFYVFLLHKLKRSDVVTLEHTLSALKSESKDTKNSPLFALPSDRPKVIEMCCDLNEKGHIMFIEHPTIINMSWLILDKAPLLHEILGTLFSPTDFPQHRPLSYSTGVVPLSRFDKHFSTKHSYPSTLSLSFLSRMEYCREIKDPVVLKSIIKEEEFSKLETYYFFPNLVCLKRPNDKWSKGKDSKFTYNSGWLIQCKAEGECFSPHFIQALLLRLAFSFTPKEEEYGAQDFETYSDSSESEEEEESQITDVVMKRLCSVWKNGIYWRERSGVKTVVEIINQTTLVLLMQCMQGCEMELVKRRSSIMLMVISAKNEFCSKAELREYFLHPKVVTHPLPNLRDIQKFLFPLHQVVKSIEKKSPCVINDQDEHVILEDLLYYEPFSELSKNLTKVKCRNFPDQEKISIFRGRKPTIQGI